MARSIKLLVACVVAASILPVALFAQTPIAQLTFADTAKVADYDNGYYVVGTSAGSLYVVDELGQYTATDLGVGPVWDLRIV